MPSSRGAGRMPGIPLVRPTITPADRAYLSRFVMHGLGDSCDREIAALEREVAESLGVAGAVAVSSGTAALHLALMALGIRQGDEVVIPTYTCVALAHAVHLCGATPVLADNRCSLQGYQFTPGEDEVRRCLTRATKAAIISHAFGSLAEFPWDGFDIPSIEDFTLSLGAKANRRTAGSLGTIGVASLNAAKMISAGQGGIVVSRDKHLLERVRELGSFENRVVGWRQVAADDLHGTYAQAVNYQMSGLQAALGLSQWRQLPKFIARRVALAQRYTERFRRIGIDCPDVPKDGSNVFYRYMISAPGRVMELIPRLSERGIELGRGVYPPLHVLLGLESQRFPGAMKCIEQLISVPLYPSLRETDVTHLLATLEQELSRPPRKGAGAGLAAAREATKHARRAIPNRAGAILGRGVRRRLHRSKPPS